MGKVYRAHDKLLDREVAIKVLNKAGLGTEGQTRLLREARAVAKLDHPNIVAVYDAGQEGDRAFIVMQLVEGESLHDHPPNGIDEVIEIAKELCSALTHAHNAGIIHRDIKPENVIRTPDGGIMLMDFGLARPTASRLTVEGSIIGTVYYLSPEQALGEEVDGRADLYSLGVLLYELATGKLPFSGDDPLSVISQHLHASVVPPRAYNIGIPSQFEDLILRLLSKEPERRPGSANEVLQELMQIKTISAESIEIGGQSLLAQIVRGKLVGRDDEIGVLQSLWLQVSGGKAQLVLISGEPGVGKTRLANELIANSRLRGAQIFRGGCYEYEASVPYLPFTEALRDWVHTQSDEKLRVGIQDTAAELSKLAPEIESRIGPLTPNPQLSPDEERLRLFDNVARFLESLSEPSGLLIFIDDLHWADRVTLALLHYLLRRLREKRILMLGAYREVELDRSHPLAASLVEWNRERLVTRIQLDRLTEEQCGRLLSSMFGQEEVSKEFTQAIYCETEGNPFFIEEVIKSLIEGGQIYRENGGWGRGEIMDLAIPQSVKEAIGRRLDRLDEESISVLHHAAILGKTFDFYELKAVIGDRFTNASAQEESILDALDRAGKAQLIQPGKGESFAFTHDKIREVLYEELNPVRRRRLHRRLAEGLENLYSEQSRDVPVQDLAYHFIQSGELEKGMDYALQAAGKARRLYAHEEALDYLQSALESAEELDRTEMVAEIYETIGDIQSEQGLVYQAVNSYLKSLNLVETDEKRASIKNSIGSNYIVVGDDQGITYLHQAYEELASGALVGELAINLAMQGRYHHYKAQHGKAIEYLEQARKLAEPLNDANTLMNIYGFLAGAYQHLARFDKSNQWAKRCIDLGERMEYPAAVAIGYEFIAENNIFSGDWKGILEAADQDRVIGEKIGSLDRVAWAKFGKLNGLYEKGDLRTAKSVGEDCFALAEQIGENRLQIWSGGLMILIDEMLGEHELAHRNADSFLLKADEIGQVALQCWIRCAAGFVSLQHGNWERALELGQQGVDLYSPTDNNQSWLFISRILINALHKTNKLEKAQRFADEYLELARESRSFFYEGLILREKGRVFSTQKDLESAKNSFDQSVDLFERMDCRLELAFTLYNRALFHNETGKAGMARADASRAVELFEWCGAITESARAEQLINDHF